VKGGLGRPLLAQKEGVVNQRGILQAAAELVIVLTCVTLADPADDSPQEKFLSGNVEYNLHVPSGGSGIGRNLHAFS